MSREPGPKKSRLIVQRAVWTGFWCDECYQQLLYICRERDMKKMPKRHQKDFYVPFEALDLRCFHAASVTPSGISIPDEVGARIIKSYYEDLGKNERP